MDRIFQCFLTAYSRGHFLTIKGEATREDYWYYILTHSLINVGVLVLALLFVYLEWEALAIGLLGLYLLFLLVSIIPSLTLTVRRYHDVGYSGKLFLAIVLGILAPFFGAIYLALDHAQMIAMGYAYGVGIPESVPIGSFILCVFISHACLLANLIITALPPKAVDEAQETE